MRLSRYLDKWIRHGTWYPDLQLRLFDRRRGHWGRNNPRDRVLLEGSVGRLNGDIKHEVFRNFADHMRTIENYTTIMAEGMYARGKRATVLNLFVSPFWRFTRFYIIEGGFLDGWRGLVLAFLAAQYGGRKKKAPTRSRP